MRLKSVSQDTQQILEEFNRTYKEEEKKDEPGERVADKFNAVSCGRMTCIPEPMLIETEVMYGTSSKANS